MAERDRLPRGMTPRLLSEDAAAADHWLDPSNFQREPLIQRLIVDRNFPGIRHSCKSCGAGVANRVANSPQNHPKPSPGWAIAPTAYAVIDVGAIADQMIEAQERFEQERAR